MAANGSETKKKAPSNDQIAADRFFVTLFVLILFREVSKQTACKGVIPRGCIVSYTI